MKKALYIPSLVIGIILLLSVLMQIPEVIGVVLTSKSDFAFGSVIGYLVFVVIGLLLIRYGYRGLNHKKKKHPESIDDIGRS